MPEPRDFNANLTIKQEWDPQKKEGCILVRIRHDRGTEEFRMPYESAAIAIFGQGDTDVGGVHASFPKAAGERPQRRGQ